MGFYYSQHTFISNFKTPVVSVVHHYTIYLPPSVLCLLFLLRFQNCM